MEKLTFKVGTTFCAECSLALRRFIGHMDGVESVETEQGSVVVTFDTGRIDEEHLDGLVRDSVEKLGYKIQQ